MSSSLHCSACDTELPKDATRCGHCGQPTARFVYKSRVAAAVLALFGGIFGLHRFYLGQWRGLVYLLLCWTPLPILVGWIECVVFLATDQPRWNQKYNAGMNAGRESGKVVALFITAAGILLIGAAASLLMKSASLLQSMAPARPLVAPQLGQQAALAVTRYVETSGRRPSRLEELDLSEPTRAQLAGQVRLNRGQITIEAGNGQGSLIMEPVLVNGSVLWDCSASTLAARYWPAVCR